MDSETTLDYRLIFALMNGRVSDALRRRLDADFLAAGINITCDQWAVLMAISQRDVCNQQDLCDATSFQRPRMTRIINALQELRAVTRRKSRTDFRNNYINLTLSGIDLVERAQVAAVRTLKDCLRGLSKMDVLTSQQSLNTVLDNINRRERQLAQEQSEEHHRLSEAKRRAVRRMHSSNPTLKKPTSHGK